MGERKVGLVLTISLAILVLCGVSAGLLVGIDRAPRLRTPAFDVSAAPDPDHQAQLTRAYLRAHLATGDEVRLACEARPEVAVGGQPRVHGLDGDGVPLRVQGPVHDAHAARAEPTDQAMGPHVFGVVGVQGGQAGDSAVPLRGGAHVRLSARGCGRRPVRRRFAPFGCAPGPRPVRTRRGPARIGRAPARASAERGQPERSTT